MKDIFDYNNVMGILAGMSDKQLETLAEKLVNRFDQSNLLNYLLSFVPTFLQYGVFL